MKYILLLWTEDIAKFVKEYANKVNTVSFIKTIILGNQLKVEDYKALNSLENFVYEIDEEYSINRNISEVFVFGKCVEYAKIKKDTITFVTYQNASKELLDLGKNINFPILSYSQLIKTPIKKEIMKKESTKKEVPVKEKKGVVTLQIKKTESSTIKKNGNSTKKDIKEEIKKIIMKSTLEESQKEFFLKDSSIENIKKSILNASDISIGLPFQLQMHFGTNGKQIESFIQKKFDFLKGLGE